MRRFIRLVASLLHPTRVTVLCHWTSLLLRFFKCLRLVLGGGKSPDRPKHRGR